MDESEKHMLAAALAVKAMKECLPALLELAEIQAKLWKHKYDALRRVGFDPKQALQLCKDG